MKKVVQDLTSGGIDWQREKWQSGLGSKFIHQGEKNAAKYRFTRCCDEVFLQTLLYNSSYSLNMYFDEDSKRYYNMRYVDFQRGNPYVFRIDDEGLLNSRKEIFARKFDYVIDKDIIFN